MKVQNKLLLLIFLVIAACNNKNSVNIEENLNRLINDYGFEFYDSFDMHTQLGFGTVDFSNLSYPFYAVRIDSSSIDIHHYLSEKRISYTRYKKNKDYYISTKIESDISLLNFFSREVTIYHIDRKLLYFYVIYHNYEKLVSVEFVSNNGLKSEYENTTNSYYHYCDTLKEEDVPSLFPTLKKL